MSSFEVPVRENYVNYYQRLGRVTALRSLLSHFVTSQFLSRDESRHDAAFATPQ